MSKTILKVENLSKAYSGVYVLNDISLEIIQGEIHALCGENGAGKSTLIKLLTGAIAPNSGKLIVDGEMFDKLTPRQSMELGIAVIYQEFSLIPYLSVAENIFFGREIAHHGIRDIKVMKQQASQLCKDMGVTIDVNARVCDLGIAYQQIVEILKAVSLKSRIIIMDEPTAPLTVRETQIFFGLIKKLKENGTTIIFISHRLEEVFEICDRVTVLCDGNKILTAKTSDITRQRLVAAMVGRELTENYPRSNRVLSDKEIVLKVQGVSNSNVHNISFALRKGEILGFGGLVGAGRTELMRILFGVDKFQAGEMKLNCKKYSPTSPGSALKHGVGLIPEDRKHLGIIACRSVRENLCLSAEQKLATCLYLPRNRENALTEQYIKELNIKTHGMKQLIRNLSGGNQQKVVLGKILATNCNILIFDEPTRGIDVGAKQEIYELMVRLAEQGKSIIMVSSEMPELIGMSDRILVMASGQIQAELNRSEYSQERILEIASNGLTKTE